MKLVCAPKNHAFDDDGDELNVILYGSTDRLTRGSIGAAIEHQVYKDKLQPASKAWDFLSLALSVTAADLACHRRDSPDGWTRQIDIDVAISDPVFWNSQIDLVQKMLGFLTTDKWRVRFIAGGSTLVSKPDLVRPAGDCVALLSGGLDSYIGNIDLVAGGNHPFVVSQTVRGDAEKQRLFAGLIGGGLQHLQVNHNAVIPNSESPPSQRARSIIFLAYGVIAATSLARYDSGQGVVLYVCENGFISINPPLTPTRLGSLSTRTTHPVFLGMVQQLFDAAGLRVQLENPYQLKTKGEMLRECKDQNLLGAHASETTSCGRFKQFGYTHCGRCLPCLVRRAAFLKWGETDLTDYVYQNLGRKDDDHAGFDDVRAAAMAVAEVKASSLEKWVGPALSTVLLDNTDDLQAAIGRGLNEIESLLIAHGVK